MILPQSLERIIALGGGVSIDASVYLPHSLERFAALASKSGATLIIYNSDSLLPQTMERIAALGQGRGIFEFKKHGER